MYVVLQNTKTGKYFVSTTADRWRVTQACKSGHMKPASKELRECETWDDTQDFIKCMEYADSVLKKILL